VAGGGSRPADSVSSYAAVIENRTHRLSRATDVYRLATMADKRQSRLDVLPARKLKPTSHDVTRRHIHVAWRHTSSCDIVRRRTTSHDNVWRHRTSYDVVRRRATLCDVV